MAGLSELRERHVDMQGLSAAIITRNEEAQPLRILQLYPKADYFTGAAIQLLELARGLAGRGHHVVVGTHPSAVWTEKCRAAGLAYYPVPMKRSLNLRSVAKLVAIIRAHRIQVVHCHKGRARNLALLAGLFVKIPVLVLNRGVSFPVEPLSRLGYTTRRVAAIVAVSDSIKRRLVSQGIPAQKIEVIYSGTDGDRFHPNVDGAGIRRELGLSSQHFLITQIGTRSGKGNDDVLDAMAAVVSREPRARLLLVGTRQPEPLYEKARTRGVDHILHVFGYREDIPEILAASDCCVDASYEGLGLTGTLREALATETPVIGTDIEGNPELILHGETGLLVPPRNPQALAAATLRLMENPAKAREMARAGRDRVELLFSTRVKVERTENLYRRLLTGRCPD